LLAQLYLDEIARFRSEYTVKKALRNLPKGPNAYDALYSKTIERIQKQPTQDLAKRVLSLVVWARRPLTIQELQHALAINDGTVHLDEQSITEVEDIVSVCEGLIRLNHKDSILQLAHYTTQQFFEKNREIWFPDPECYILGICLELLSSSVFETGFCQTDKEFEKRLDSFPLYDYAARTWGAHACRTSAMNDAVSEFLKDRPKLEAMAQCLMAYRRYSQEVPRLMTGLHVTAVFGLKTGVDVLIDAGWDPDARNTYGRSPLSFAVEHGHEAIVQAFLHREVEPDSRDKNGRTPFSYACQGGFQTIAEALVGHGANTQLRDDFGRSPISYAVQYGHTAIVKDLIRRGDTQVDRATDYGITPLGWAAIGGNLTMAKVLVDNGVNVDPCDSAGMTPAIRAAKGGHGDVLHYLVEKGANVNAADKEGRTMLSHAAAGGHDKVTQLLLSMGQVEADRPCHCGRSPLSYAAELGHQTVVKKFLSSSEVRPDIEDADGWTPLFWAVDSGWDAIVAVLLNNDRVDANHKDRFGQTALSIAARMGDEDVTKALLSKKGTEVDIPDATGWTPLIQAAKNGSEAVLGLLLENGGANIDPNHQDTAGQTALHWAAAMGNTKAVRTLASHPLINVNLTDMVGRSPMCRAAARGHVAVVAVLLHARADVNTEESSHQTALRAAVEHGQDEVAELLLAHGADLERGCSNGWTLVHVASLAASSRLQQLFLEAHGLVEAEAEAELEHEDLFGLVGLFGGADSPLPGRTSSEPPLAQPVAA
jgi:ankyrin repeat protein